MSCAYCDVLKRMNVFVDLILPSAMCPYVTTINKHDTLLHYHWSQGQQLNSYFLIAQNLEFEIIYTVDENDDK